jgi:hypothetical protein
LFLQALLLHSAQPASTYSSLAFNSETAYPSTTLGASHSPDHHQGFGWPSLSAVLQLPGRGKGGKGGEGGEGGAEEGVIWTGAGLPPGQYLQIPCTAAQSDGCALVPGATLVFLVSLPTPTPSTTPISAFRATLVWTDPPAAVGAARAIVNDLDLYLQTPDGYIYTGNHREPQRDEVCVCVSARPHHSTIPPFHQITLFYVHFISFSNSFSLLVSSFPSPGLVWFDLLDTKTNEQ